MGIGPDPERRYCASMMTAPSMSAMRYDITAKPVGSFFGGKQGLSVACLVCGSPALLISTSGNETSYAHSFELSLNRHNEPTCTWVKRCTHRPRKGATLDAQPAESTPPAQS